MDVLLLLQEKTTGVPVVPKSFRYAQSRRSGKSPLQGRCPARGGGVCRCIDIAMTLTSVNPSVRDTRLRMSANTDGIYNGRSGRSVPTHIIGIAQ